MRIHAIRTGSVRIKRSQVRGRGRSLGGCALLWRCVRCGNSPAGLCQMSTSPRMSVPTSRVGSERSAPERMDATGWRR